VGNRGLLSVDLGLRGAVVGLSLLIACVALRDRRDSAVALLGAALAVAAAASAIRSAPTFPSPWQWWSPILLGCPAAVRSCSGCGRARLSLTTSYSSAGTAPCGLNQPHPLQARMPVLPDDDMVVHRDAERTGDIDDRFCHLDVGLRRRRIAGGVVVQDALETTYRIEKLRRTLPANSDRGRQ
jgi:hypothetical protein